MHLESHQRGVADGMRVSWELPLDVVCEVKLAKEIDESTSVVVDFVMASLTVEQQTQKNVSWRYTLSSYVAKFDAEKCPIEMQVNWKTIVLR